MLTGEAFAPSIEEFEVQLGDVWIPRQHKSVVDWAYDHIRLPKKAAAESGPLDFKRTPYAIEICEALEDKRNERVIWVAGAQVAKTTVLSTVALKQAIENQAPVLMALSTIGLAEGYSKERLQPTINNSPYLLEQFGPSKSKDSNNTILFKQTVTGGHVVLVGSNSSAEMRSRPIKVLLLDEVSSYQPNKEGDVVNLLIQRQVTFFDRITGMASTPLFTGDRILSEYENTDQRKFFVKCPHCEFEQWLQWGFVRWPKDEPTKAQYQCESCERQWTEKQRRDAIMRGIWKPTVTPKPGYEKVPGYHLSALYSPWLSLAQLAVEFTNAKDKLRLQTFVNTKLAQGFEIREYNAVEATNLVERAEPYQPGTVPDGALVLTAGVDVQVDRLVIGIYGWGPGEEAWLISYLNLYGNPLLPFDSEDSPWPQLDQLIEASFKHDSGALLKISLTNIDSGYATQEVYKYVLSRRRKYRIRAVDGRAGKLPITNKPSYPQVTGHGKPNKSGIQLWPVGTVAAKKMIYARLGLEAAGPGYFHAYQSVDSDYFLELTGEQIVIKYKNGFPYEEWEMRPGRENHALDCTVYALAAAYHLRINLPQYPWQALRDSMASVTDPAVTDLEVTAPQPPKASAKAAKPNKYTGKPRGSHFKRRR